MDRRKKKWLQTVILLVLLVDMAAGAWLIQNRRIKESPSLYETVDQNGIFHIYTPNDMKWFIEYVALGHGELDAVLEADIDMEGLPFPSDSRFYGGHFDGQGHTLRNQKWVLFTTVKKTALVERLNQENVDIQMKRGPSGGIAGENYGIISDCVNYAEVVSVQTGENYETDEQPLPYGAGGITARSASPEADYREAYQPEKNAIINCVNYGTVTARTLAGGICGTLYDRGSGHPNNLSVQEMVETKGFGDYNALPESIFNETEPENEERKAPENEDRKEPEVEAGEECESENLPVVDGDLVNGIHFSVINCKNYGTVTVEQMTDADGSYTQAAGICANLRNGDLYHCANLGKVRISEAAPRVSEETGRVYTNTPYAIAEARGLSPSISHIIDCVSLEGCMPVSMWCESVMEVTEEELKLWEEGKLPYVSNNWKFDLEQAVSFCELESLGIAEDQDSAGIPYDYFCDDFVLRLPEGFLIQEEYLDGELYALRIRADAEEAHKLPAEWKESMNEGYETWILRKDADIDRAITEVAETVNRMEIMDDQFLMESIYDTLTNSWFLNIECINLPFHVNAWQREQDGKRLFIESGIPSDLIGKYQREGNHILGNYLSMPLEGTWKDGLDAKWILLFTNNRTNILPSRSYMDLVEHSFYPLGLQNGMEKIVIQKGDSLTGLAVKTTGKSQEWKMLADLNGIEDPNLILEGDTLIVPNREQYDKRPERVQRSWVKTVG